MTSIRRSDLDQEQRASIRRRVEARVRSGADEDLGLARRRVGWRRVGWRRVGWRDAVGRSDLVAGLGGESRCGVLAGRAYAGSTLAGFGRFAGFAGASSAHFPPVRRHLAPVRRHLPPIATTSP